MKRLMIGGLSVLLMSAATISAAIATSGAVPKAIAQMSIENDGRMGNTQSNEPRIEAVDLVTSAYRGEFEEQGIPGYGQLVNDYEGRRIDAEDIVKAAIEAGQLTPQALEDEAYLNAVRVQLRDLHSNR